jgi:large subunit ribosomal protein L32
VKVPALITCPQCRQYMRSHHVCPHCGTYRGRQVIEVKTRTPSTPGTPSS